MEKSFGTLLCCLASSCSNVDSAGDKELRRQSPAGRYKEVGGCKRETVQQLMKTVSNVMSQVNGLLDPHDTMLKKVFRFCKEKILVVFDVNH